MQLPNSLIVSSTRPRKNEKTTKLETINFTIQFNFFSLSFHFSLFPYVYGYGYHIFLYISRHASLLSMVPCFITIYKNFSFKKYGSFPFEMIHLNPYGNASKREDMQLLHSSYGLLKVYHS